MTEQEVHFNSNFAPQVMKCWEHLDEFFIIWCFLFPRKVFIISTKDNHSAFLIFIVWLKSWLRTGVRICGPSNTPSLIFSYVKPGKMHRRCWKHLPCRDKALQTASSSLTWCEEEQNYFVSAYCWIVNNIWHCVRMLTTQQSCMETGR